MTALIGGFLLANLNSENFARNPPSQNKTINSDYEPSMHFALRSYGRLVIYRRLDVVNNEKERVLNVITKFTVVR